METYSYYADGKWLEPASGDYFDACTQSSVGGYNQSGYGRENGWDGMRDFLQNKSVWLSTAHEIPAPF